QVIKIESQVLCCRKLCRAQPGTSCVPHTECRVPEGYPACASSVTSSQILVILHRVVPVFVGHTYRKYRYTKWTQFSSGRIGCVLWEMSDGRVDVLVEERDAAGRDIEVERQRVSEEEGKNAFRG
ncbi:hypothetical protein JOQ06_003927, partial [Pogonophryne albipinna]